MMPSLFICHGSPMLALEENTYTETLQQIGQRFAPKAIVLFTAHWEQETTTISFKDDPYDTIYDFGGFPEELSKVTYPAKGSTEVASIVEELLKGAGIASKRDEKRGLDHGAWVILKHLYPNAEIPVVQVSINPYIPPKEQYKIGEALRGLGNQDILVIGSGGTSHNLRLLKWGQTEVEPWTNEFDDWLLDNIKTQNVDSLFNYHTLAPHANLAVPRAEHFVPLFIAMGSGTAQTPTVLHRSYDLGTLSLIAIEF
ncbi:DODA-type extradiol aromatic ring-opening family dioxygenase [Bacillus sp. FJAT-45350]|uniref:DODA-type extradiol aromatic ring-opening family dioxygenase n=1 Tax=Bacillus sp. FJAT-45350 TaxID=2011014 RepID=UPI000BB69CC6|nr:class III extradiol ring-cleavage dioxygenase [Bacillus sp. FJAT-45350]